ncbi:uncharacterized protein LOC135817715 [Sycon ciliatum]|uniref:uncharacterized protein LOC135817715 n=1 Tax=Sycon ciliatum TaxID=27933 RepID=UPI0020AB6C8A|eukprot:scpid19700/ scgid32961/ 
MALPFVRRSICASQAWHGAILSSQARSVHVSSSLSYRRPEVNIPEEKYPGSYTDTSVIPPSNGLRRVEPPDWDGMGYLDKKGWFHEWLFGRSPKGDDPVDGAYMPQSRKEYHEWEELLQEAREAYFGSYPPKPLPKDYYFRVIDFCIKYDNEEWLEKTFDEYHFKHYRNPDPDFEALESKVNEYRSLKRQERWDTW